ncbi:MAG: ATP-grasp fold amidoligase family protein [Paracoccaceae bacterium]|nr:ATP-grasp fold amidoligase family protein [Paracoccaceae bacterium]
MSEDAVSPFVLRQAARSALTEIYDQGLFGAGEPTPRGTLRGIDVLPPGVVQQKLSRAAKIVYHQRGRVPDLAAPATFFEKLALAKFFAPVPMPSPADKLGVGHHIPEAWRDDVSTIEVLWSGAAPITGDLIDRLGLAPGRYYAKSNGGSGRNIPFDVPLPAGAAETLADKSAGWLTASHGERAGEWWYGMYRLQNFIERNAAPAEGSLTDWKFHIGGGDILAVQVDHDRQTNHRQTLYTADFDYIPEELFFRRSPAEAEPPFYPKMRAAALEIGNAFEYARVDLYHADGRMYLGEITLAPMGGLRPPRSPLLDERMGRAWSRGRIGGGGAARDGGR